MNKSVVGNLQANQKSILNTVNLSREYSILNKISWLVNMLAKYAYIVQKKY